ncbi:MAG TPA: non-homologous end-joining DNA ligase [Pseudonocardiaceae bacterium]|nr:non-homologous end-joining DNA ligase [Pseudonocardiaceae bacterium]
MADLQEYRRRRDARRTPEPVPADGPLPRGDNDVFVVQEHHARRLHYDVRLERDGVLVSWAVPKGLPPRSDAVRLAVHTEDHPMEYAQFEGDIPAAEYGGGHVDIWDRGTYETLKWTRDEVEVVLHGQRVDGRYVFFRKDRGTDDKNWMVRRRSDPADKAAESGPVSVRVEDRQLRLTNLRKPLYPEDGFTKGQVIDYYRQIAPVLLPHLADRPVTFRRYPNGVDGTSFFEKDVSRHAPDWVRTVRLDTPGSTKNSETADFPMIDGLPALIWAANLAALELHVPQWTVGPRGARRAPDLMVFDLDPGAPATVVECCRVADLIDDVLAEDGLTGYPKTSGAKGLQLYVPVRVGSAERTTRYARALAQRLAREHPDLVVATMAKAQRTGRIFVDWDQNNRTKTTIAPYSLRARDRPTVSTPVTWREVRRCRKPEDLVFVTDQVLGRVGRHGDLLADMAEHASVLPR